MKKIAIILVSVLLAAGVSAQNSKSSNQSKEDKLIDSFLQQITKTHDLNLSAITPYITKNFKKLVKYAESQEKKSQENEVKAYWAWFKGYLHITTRNEMDKGYAELNKAQSLTKNQYKLKCEILMQKAKYFDYIQESDKEIRTLEEVNSLMEENGEEPLFDVYAKIAKIQRQRGKAMEAIDNYSKAINRGCDNKVVLAEQYYKRSIVKLRHFDDVEGSLADLESAMKTDPNEPIYPYDHARLCVQRSKKGNNMDKAKKDCERVLEIDTVPSLASLRHCALALMDRREEAEEWLDKVMKIYGENKNNLIYIYYNKACVYALLNDIPEAEKWLKEAANLGEIGYFRLRNDADLNNMHKSPVYKELLEKASKK